MTFDPREPTHPRFVGYGPHANLVAIEARRISEGRRPTGSTVTAASHLRRFDRDVPVLTVYDGLLAGTAR